MHKRMIVAALLLALAACGGGTATPTPNQPASPAGGAPRVRVVTTMSILADVIKNVGGERVAVENIIPLGAGPEDYQATPGDSQKIADARIVFFNGHDLEEWLQPLFANAAADQPRIELSAGMAAIDDGEDGAGNPHFWLDPTYVMSYTLTIRDQLSAIDPDGAAGYAANAERYLGELKQLDADLAALAGGLDPASRKLVTNHDAFPYFARRYGFTVVGVLLENPEAELSAGELSALIDEVKAQQVKAIFSESQFNQKTAQLLADEAGLEQVVALYTDSLGDGEAGSYVQMMRYNMDAIVAALK
ncbi:MAG TPA: metal ABC transporter substrate-binding protein [Herpetosiphonaceae bacterium]|nr:metal ABC transporter substrate-binding protein [Herpetosiphonaceae bacterium]